MAIVLDVPINVPVGFGLKNIFSEILKNDIFHRAPVTTAQDYIRIG